MSIDGIRKGTVDAGGSFSVRLKPGSHDIAVTLEKYKPFETKTSVNRGDHTDIIAVLTPVSGANVAPVTGTLAIQGNPDGVGVFIDGVLKGFTESGGKLNLPLEPGSHTVRFAKDGYEDYPPKPVTITASKEEPIAFTLALLKTAAPTTPTEAYLIIHSTPGASVAVDSHPEAKIDPLGNLVVKVNPGKPVLQIGLEGYQPYSKSISVKPGEKANVSAALVAIPSPPKASPPPAPIAAPQPVQIVSFFASQLQIEQGNSTTLKWETANATDVTLDEGKGPTSVDPNSQKTIEPTSSTTYILTAKGNGALQQMRVSVRVEKPPAVAPVATPAPTVVDDKPLLHAVIDNFVAAFNAHDTQKIKAAWLGLKPQQEKQFQNFFRSTPTASIRESCAQSSLVISGDTAEWSCSETTTVIDGGHQHPMTRTSRFAFARKNGTWTISDRS